MITMENDGSVRIRRSGGRRDYEAAFISAVDEGAAEMGRILVADIKRTAEPGVMLRRGYVPGPLGRARRGAGRIVKGFMAPTERWPYWTRKSQQGFAAEVDRTRMVLQIFNRAVDARSNIPYPRFVERRGRHVARLYRDRRRKFGEAFVRGFRRSFIRRLN